MVTKKEIMHHSQAKRYLGLVFCMENPVSATEIHQEEIHAVPEKNAAYAEETPKSYPWL